MRALALLKTSFPAVIAIASLIAIWYAVTLRVPPLYFPEPASVGRFMLDNPWPIFHNAVATGERVLYGMAIGFSFGFVNAMAMARNPRLAQYNYPIVELLRPVPPLALIPFFILWFGLAERGKVLFVAAGVSMIALVTTAEAIRHVSPVYVQAARTLGAKTGFIYRTVITPAIIPSVFAGLRVAAATAFGLAIAAEYMGAQSGLGFMIMEASRVLATEVVVAGVIVIGLMSLALDYVLRLISRRLLRWAPESGA